MILFSLLRRDSLRDADARCEMVDGRDGMIAPDDFLIRKKSGPARKMLKKDDGKPIR